MKAISLIILLLFPLYISAQDINPDSAFVDTVQEWHLKGSSDKSCDFIIMQIEKS